MIGRLVDSLLGAVDVLEGTADEEVVVAEETAAAPVDVADPEAATRV